MDAAHEKAASTRVALQEAQRRAAEELAESIRGLNFILTDAKSTAKERLEAGRLIVELKKR